MNIFNKIHVLNAFKPFLRVLKAYNRANFQHHDWHYIRRSVFCALCASLAIVCIPIYIVMAIWYWIEFGFELKQSIATVPLVFSFLYVEVACIALVYKSHQISVTIQRLQILIDRREHF